MVTGEVEEANAVQSHKRLNKVLSRARMQDGTCDPCYTTRDLKYPSHFILVLPTLVQDITDRVSKWGNGGKTGRIDPFTDIYDVSLLQNVIF